MIKKEKSLIFLIIITLALMTGCDGTGKETSEKEIVLGYCPTMEKLAKELQINNNNVVLKPFDSTSSAFSSLNSGSVDVILVGRLGYKNEIINNYEKRLRAGHTLVSHNRKFVSIDELKNSKIHTAVSINVVNEYLPESTNVVFYDSVEDALKNGLNELVFLSWDDYVEDLELVIPVDIYMNKIEKFRIPVLYYKNMKIESQLLLQ